jgi:hypothetical protein
VQSPWETVGKVGVGQALHTLADAAPATLEAFPGGHSVHAPRDAAPVAELHFPAGQGVENPRAQNCPAGQGTMELLLLHKKPLGQGVHADAPGWETYPGTQGRQDALVPEETLLL